jgi:hypothetical protein
MPTVLASMNDLLFLSKIMEATKALQVPLRSLKSADKLVAAARESEDPLILLDLDDPKLDAIGLAQAVRGAEPGIDARIYAFVSHVNEDRIRAAGDGLFDRVFSRGQFVRTLPDLLRGAPASATS